MKKLLVIAGSILIFGSLFYVERADPAGHAASEEISPADAAVGMLLVAALVWGMAAAASLWLHLDTSLPEARGGALQVLRSLRWTLPLPPERVLTVAGKKRARTAKVAILTAAGCAAILMYRRHGQ